MKIYYINRYQNVKIRRGNSGYEQLVKYTNKYIPVSGLTYLNKILKVFFNKHAPKDYLWQNSSTELIALFKAIIFKRPIHYLYADKDVLFGHLLKKIPILRKRIKVIGTLHWNKDFTKKKLEIIKNLDKVIVLSKSFQQIIANINPNTHAVFHGIDLSFWSKRQKFKENKMILVLGNSNRNHKKQAQTMVELNSRNSEISFIVKTTQKNSKHYNNIENVKFIDFFLTDLELKNYYYSSQMVILIQENSVASNVILESIATGTPLLTNRIDSTIEYLGHEYPLYYDDIAINDICEKKLIETHEYMLLLREKFDWERIVQETLEICEHV